MYREMKKNYHRGNQQKNNEEKEIKEGKPMENERTNRTIKYIKTKSTQREKNVQENYHTGTNVEK